MYVLDLSSMFLDMRFKINYLGVNGLLNYTWFKDKSAKEKLVRHVLKS